MLRTPVPLLPRHLDIAGDAGDVERRVDGMKIRFEAVKGVGGNDMPGARGEHQVR